MIDAATSASLPIRGPRAVSLPLNRMQTLLVTERKSRKRKRDSSTRLREVVEGLPPALLNVLLKMIPRSPSTRKDLVQSEVCDIAATIIE